MMVLNVVLDVTSPNGWFDTFVTEATTVYEEGAAAAGSVSGSVPAIWLGSVMLTMASSEVTAPLSLLEMIVMLATEVTGNDDGDEVGSEGWLEPDVGTGAVMTGKPSAVKVIGIG